MQFAHLDPGDTCFFNEKAACVHCDTENPEDHKVAAGCSKFVVDGFVPVTDDDVRLLETEKYFETLDFPVISKFEIRKKSELVNSEDRMLKELQTHRLSRDQVVPKTVHRVPNYALTENDRRNMIASMRQYSDRFHNRFRRRPFAINENDARSLIQLKCLLNDHRLQERDMYGNTHVLVRSVEEDCGMTLYDYMKEQVIKQREALGDSAKLEIIWNHQATVVNSLRNFIKGICKIIRQGVYHFDVKDDNVTCKVDPTGQMTLKTIDWGYGHKLTPVTELRSFALQVPQDFSFFLKAEAMTQQQDWKPPEFSMFWLLCWLISYNFHTPEKVAEILNPNFTFTEARNMLYSSLRVLGKSHSMRRFGEWHRHYKGLVQKNMWELVHANFTRMFNDSDAFSQIPDEYLPVIFAATNGSLESFEKYLKGVGQYFFPDDCRYLNVIRYDTERFEIVVNWRFIFKECYEVIDASRFSSELSPELPDFVMSLFLKVFYMRNDVNFKQNEPRFARGEEMLSQRMDCWGYAVIFKEFSQRCLSRYDSNLKKWWVMVLNNPFTALRNLELIIQEDYWPKILRGEVEPEHIARVILPSFFQNVMTPPIAQDPYDSQAGAPMHPAPLTVLQNPQWLRLSPGHRYKFEDGADMRGLSRLFGNPRRNPHLNAPLHQRTLYFYNPSTHEPLMRPRNWPPGRSARGGSSGSPRTYEDWSTYPSAAQSVAGAARGNSSIRQTLAPSPLWNAHGGSAGSPSANEAWTADPSSVQNIDFYQRTDSDIPPPPPLLPRGLRSPPDTQTSRSTSSDSDQSRKPKKQRPDSDFIEVEQVFDTGDDQGLQYEQGGLGFHHEQGGLGFHHEQGGLGFHHEQGGLGFHHEQGDLEFHHEQDTYSCIPNFDIAHQNVAGQHDN
jgi:hypothetical protein